MNSFKFRVGNLELGVLGINLNIKNNGKLKNEILLFWITCDFMRKDFLHYLGFYFFGSGYLQNLTSG